jgi:hypothetical protein
MRQLGDGVIAGTRRSGVDKCNRVLVPSDYANRPVSLRICVHSTLA